jgi:hypothetical protein
MFGDAVDPEVVDRDDVRMRDGCGRPRFDLEARALLPVGAAHRVEHLDRDVPVQPFVDRAVHDRHAPAPEPGADHVAAAQAMTGQGIRTQRRPLVHRNRCTRRTGPDNPGTRAVRAP